MVTAHRPLLIKLSIALVLGLVFLSYLKPDLMVDVANTLLVLCGW
ncbi:hypothetical protein [Polynucleobacter sp. MWH-Loch1C5]|nr:hypothetical protein [Polynucleobacter sp. MWH-Loch1C5]